MEGESTMKSMKAMKVRSGRNRVETRATQGLNRIHEVKPATYMKLPGVKPSSWPIPTQQPQN